MTVGKLKEYLNDIDDNVEIKGLLLRCENGYAIQSKMRWIDNEDIIAELEKIKKEMELIHNRYKINFQGHSMSVAKDCIEIIDERISELK